MRKLCCFSLAFMMIIYYMHSILPVAAAENNCLIDFEKSIIGTSIENSGLGIAKSGHTDSIISNDGLQNFLNFKTRTAATSQPLLTKTLTTALTDNVVVKLSLRTDVVGKKMLIFYSTSGKAASLTYGTTSKPFIRSNSISSNCNSMSTHTNSEWHDYMFIFKMSDGTNSGTISFYYDGIEQVNNASLDAGFQDLSKVAFRMEEYTDSFNSNYVDIDNIQIYKTEQPIPAMPTFSVSNGEIRVNQAVEITSESGSVIYYTTDGSYPEIADKNIYQSKIKIVGSNIIIKAISYKNGISSAMAVAGPFETDNIDGVAILSNPQYNSGSINEITSAEVECLSLNDAKNVTTILALYNGNSLLDVKMDNCTLKKGSNVITTLIDANENANRACLYLWSEMNGTFAPLGNPDGLNSSTDSTNATTSMRVDNININHLTGNVTIQGTAGNGKNPIGLYIYNEIGTAAFSQCDVINGQFAFDVNIAEKYRANSLTARISRIGEANVINTITIVSQDNINRWLSEINSLDDSAALKEKISEYFDRIIRNVDTELYNQYASAIARILINEKYHFNYLSDLETAINKALAVAVFNTVDANNFSDYFNNDKYMNILGIDFDVLDSAYPLIEKYRNDKAKSSIINKTGSLFDTRNEVYFALKEANCVTLINNSKASEIKNAFNSYSDLTEIIDSGFDDLISKCNEAVFKSLENTGFTNLKSIVDTVKASNREYEDTVSSYKPVSRPKGGGGGVVSVTGVIPNVGINDTPANNTLNNTVLFSDLNDVAWANDAIMELADKKLISGRGDGKFAPNDTITREELVKIVILMLGENGDTYSCDFEDVNPGQWYYNYIATAVKLGIIEGFSDGYFGVGESITRQDLLTVLKRVIALKNINLNEKDIEFTDSSDISEYALGAVKSFVGAGIVKGFDDGSFAPFENTTRAECAKILAGVLKILNLED